MSVVEKPARGRPKAYDAEDALQRAGALFWKRGFSGTSLDELASATGMNRPSLRAAFGDKHDLYLKVLRNYWDLKFAAMDEALGHESLEEALLRAFDAALSAYFSDDYGARGCFVVGTAITETVEDPEIREIATEGFQRLDAGFKARLRVAREAGELQSDADLDTLAFLVTATMQSIAIRARTGTPRGELHIIARTAVNLICAAQCDGRLSADR